MAKIARWVTFQELQPLQKSGIESLGCHIAARVTKDEPAQASPLSTNEAYQVFCLGIDAVEFDMRQIWPDVLVLQDFIQ